MKKSAINKRRYLRFKSEQGTAGKLILSSMTVEGVMVNESYRGCCIALDSSEHLDVIMSEKCQVCIGSLYPVDGFVRWINAGGDGTLKIGIEFDVPHLK